MPKKEIVHFLHINKNAGTQLRHVIEQVNATAGIALKREPHKVTLPGIPADARYFFSIRDPISRFKSGFYCRKRKGQPRYHSEWTRYERPAFETFEHANDLAEALFRDDERGRQATAAIRSIVHLAKNQVDWFPMSGSMLAVRPPVWILRTENFEADLAVLLDRLGINAEVAITRDPVTGHRSDYTDVPPLSELAVANLKRWYAQDIAFCEMCRDWLERETAKAQDATGDFAAPANVGAPLRAAG